jgi:TetR/AcrR family fatty acid metabolism transcriptional regulator
MKTDTRSPRVRARAAAPEERVRKRQELKRTASDVYRAAILEAAERVFGQRTFAEAKIADVAREAGVAAGTLYNYFDSKEAIFRSLVEKLGEEMLGRLRPLADSSDPPLRRLMAMVQVILGYVEEHRQMFVVLTELGPMAELGMARAAGETADRVRKSIVGQFEDTVAEAMNAGQLRHDLGAVTLTHALLGIVHGQLQAWLVAGGKRGLVARAELFMELFLHGAGPRS